MKSITVRIVAYAICVLCVGVFVGSKLLPPLIEKWSDDRDMSEWTLKREKQLIEARQKAQPEPETKSRFSFTSDTEEHYSTPPDVLRSHTELPSPSKQPELPQQSQ